MTCCAATLLLHHEVQYIAVVFPLICPTNNERVSSLASPCSSGCEASLLHPGWDSRVQLVPWVRMATYLVFITNSSVDSIITMFNIPCHCESSAILTCRYTTLALFEKAHRSDSAMLRRQPASRECRREDGEHVGEGCLAGSPGPLGCQPPGENPGLKPYTKCRPGSLATKNLPCSSLPLGPSRFGAGFCVYDACGSRCGK